MPDMGFDSTWWAHSNQWCWGSHQDSWIRCLYFYMNMGSQGAIFQTATDMSAFSCCFLFGKRPFLRIFLYAIFQVALHEAGI